MNLTFFQSFLTLMLVVNLVVILRALIKHYYLTEKCSNAGDAHYKDCLRFGDPRERCGSN